MNSRLKDTGATMVGIYASFGIIYLLYKNIGIDIGEEGDFRFVGPMTYVLLYAFTHLALVTMIFMFISLLKFPCRVTLTHIFIILTIIMQGGYNVAECINDNGHITKSTWIEFGCFCGVALVCLFILMFKKKLSGARIIIPIIAVIAINCVYFSKLFLSLGFSLVTIAFVFCVILDKMYTNECLYGDIERYTRNKINELNYQYTNQQISYMELVCSRKKLLQDQKIYINARKKNTGNKSFKNQQQFER